MVELEVEDYTEILDWFILAFGPTKTMEKLPTKTKKTFYKLNFLAEDKIKEERMLNPGDKDD